MVIQWTNEKTIHSGRKVRAIYPVIFLFCFQKHLSKYICIHIYPYMHICKSACVCARTRAHTCVPPTENVSVKEVHFPSGVR